MHNYNSFKWFFRLLTTREGRKIILIPILILVLFFGYTIYQDEFSNKPERIEMQDGSGDTRLTKRSSLSSFRLPKEAGEIREIIGEDVKVNSYDITLNQENQIRSADVMIKAEEAEAAQILASYKEKLRLEEGISGLSGNAAGYDIRIRYYDRDRRIEIDLDQMDSDS